MSNSDDTRGSGDNGSAGDKRDRDDPDGRRREPRFDWETGHFPKDRRNEEADDGQRREPRSPQPGNGDAGDDSDPSAS